MTENQKDKVLEILKIRGIETNEDVIYSMEEDDDKFVVCIDTNQMVIKKKVKLEEDVGDYFSRELEELE